MLMSGKMNHRDVPKDKGPSQRLSSGDCSVLVSKEGFNKEPKPSVEGIRMLLACLTGISLLTVLLLYHSPGQCDCLGRKEALGS